MNNGLMIFDGVELEILTKEDVTFEFEGTILFNGKQICEILEYKNVNRDIDRHCDEECVYMITEDKLSTEMVSRLKLNTNILTLGQRGTKFINEDGVFDLIYNSKMPKAKEFRKQVRKIVKSVQQTGKYDSIEEKLKLIEDPKEKELSLGLYSLQQALKANPNDMLLIINCKQKETELNTYKQQKQLEIVENGIKILDGKIKKTTVLREGDKSAKNVAENFKVYSKNNKPHNQFADKVAKELGFYISPTGNAGYQDDYISINLTNIGGTTVSEIKYSKKALELMEKYINTYGLKVEAQYGKRGINKGKFIKAEMTFKNGEHIFVNEDTYNFYHLKRNLLYATKVVQSHI